MRQLADFEEVWLADFEFQQPPGERPEPLCLVARELRNGRTIRLWQDELRRSLQAPFRTDADALFVAYLASAELNCFLGLGWAMPRWVLDLYAEFRLLTSGLPTPCGCGLLGALAYFGLPGGVDELTKDEMRRLAQRAGPYTAQERAALLAYCETDVDGLARLLPAMRDGIECPPTLPPAERGKAFGQAMQRGDYMKALPYMERRGVPLDVTALANLRGRWQEIEKALIARVDGAFGVHDGEHFDTLAFERYLSRSGITWPRFPDGRPRLDRDTFKDMATACPCLAPLHELRATLAQMRDWRLSVGRDGRNRCLLSPFGAKTGRNTPSASEFIFALATWLRSLIRPEPGTALAYLDYEQQEFGIAAALSGDRNMMDAYRSGDPYLAFAMLAGAVPPGATKDTHGPTRDQFKTCALGIQYAMGAEALAHRLNESPSRGRELLRLHRQTFPGYWRWSESCVSYAMLHLHLAANYGWRVHVSPATRATSLRNFLLQANGAEMLRLACILAAERRLPVCILAAERRLPVCCPVHDALLVEGPADSIDTIVAETAQAMREASELVLPGFPLRVEAKVFHWPERFADKRGRQMWATVWDLIEGGVEDITGDTRRVSPVIPPPFLNSYVS
jgi:hypothetical protein